MLEVKHLTVRSKEGRPLVQDVSFTLTPGKPMGLTGASGSGKTTIIKAVMGILPYGCAIESGEILLDGQSLEGLPARKRREYCGTVLGFIPQSPMTAFDPHMKIGAQMVQTFCLRLNLPTAKALALGNFLLLLHGCGSFLVLLPLAGSAVAVLPAGWVSEEGASEYLFISPSGWGAALL